MEFHLYYVEYSPKKFERAFDRFEGKDPFYMIELDDTVDSSKIGLPTCEDWKTARTLCTFLESFYHLTLRVSGTLYVTSNTFFFEIVGIYSLLCSWLGSEDDEQVAMVHRMKEKYDKYWGSVEKMNLLIYVATVLDPRVKLVGVQLALHRMYGQERGGKLTEKVKEAIVALFDDYKRKYAPISAQSGETSGSSFSSSVDTSGGGCVRDIMLQIRRMKNESQGGGLVKIEFDKYLNEEMDESENFDILIWWRLHGPRFPILSRLARDVLAMPISTVASESAFSTGGRHLDFFRSSLTPKMIQALICGQDWLRASPHTINLEESLDELEQLESDMQTNNIDNIIDV